MSEFEVKIIVDEKDLEAYYELRKEIFVGEQKIFAGTDIDEHDEDAIHMAALEKPGGKLVGGVRCYRLEGDTWVGGRLSAARGWRDGRVGRGLVKFAVETVKVKGCGKFLAYVQPRNVRFFERLEWKRVGEPVIHHGIAHQIMEAELGSGKSG